jgi:hypothetical protein
MDFKFCVIEGLRMEEIDAAIASGAAIEATMATAAPNRAACRTVRDE